IGIWAIAEVIQDQCATVVRQRVVGDGCIYSGVANAQPGVTVSGIDTGDRQVVVRTVGIDADAEAPAARPGNIHTADREIAVVLQPDGDAGSRVQAIGGIVDDDARAGRADILPGQVVQL